MVDVDEATGGDVELRPVFRLPQLRFVLAQRGCGAFVGDATLLTVLQDGRE